MTSAFDYNIMKYMDRRQLMDMVPKGFDFHTDPWDHQIAAFIGAIATERFLLALDLGTGKTKVSIDVCRYAQENFEPVNGIVVCLNGAVEKWVEEISTHSSSITSCAVRGQDLRNGSWWDTGSKVVKTAKEVKLDLLCSREYNLRVISFESLRSICTERIKPIQGKKGYDQINRKSMKRILGVKPNFFIIDESHKVKNKDALIFEIINVLSYHSRWRLLLTGTPFHNLLDIWAQYYIMDRGKTFGSSFYRFRDKYFEEKKKYLRNRGIEISKWDITPEGKKAIMAKMYTRAIRYDESEVHDMPGKVFEIRNYKLSPEQRNDYLNIIKKINSKEEKKLLSENNSMTFRQICSGFILRTKKVYKSNPKLDLLEELVEDIVPRDKVVIFHTFDMEYDLISKMLKRRKIKFTMINGGVKDKYTNNKKFLDDDSYRVMVANIASGSASIDLQSARYAIFFNNAHSVIDRKQAIKRVHRGKISRTRFYYDLIGENTIEKSIYNSLKNGVDLFDEVMDRKRFLQIIKGES
jgi:SNF2 family DNA or RNA helicase